MKVLVSAASKHGATAGIADAIGSALMIRGFDVTKEEPARVEDVLSLMQSCSGARSTQATG